MSARSNFPVSSAAGPGPIVLYDGVCNLCDGAIRFILPRDRAARFRFAQLQGEFARSLLAGAGLPAVDPPESIVLHENGRTWSGSTAMLRVFLGLGWPWKALGALLLVPRPIRDLVYRWIARNRYRWFGRAESCLMPRAEWKSRFIG
jgi:predicted DCC family thiol-disulfide oxidoreductase YuxK